MEPAAAGGYNRVLRKSLSWLPVPSCRAGRQDPQPYWMKPMKREPNPPPANASSLPDRATVPPAAVSRAEMAPPAPASLPTQATSAGNERWYYARGKQKVGPLSRAELTAEAQAGRLVPGAMVLREGTATWVAAASVVGLFPTKAPTVPPQASARSNDPEKVGGNWCQFIFSRPRGAARGILVSGILVSDQFSGRPGRSLRQSDAPPALSGRRLGSARRAGPLDKMTSGTGASPPALRSWRGAWAWPRNTGTGIACSG